MNTGLVSKRKVTYLFSIFTSRPLIGTLKSDFELNPTLKTFNISMEKPYLLFHLSIRKLDVKFGNCYEGFSWNAN